MRPLQETIENSGKIYTHLVEPAMDGVKDFVAMNPTKKLLDGTKKIFTSSKEYFDAPSKMLEPVTRAVEYTGGALLSLSHGVRDKLDRAVETGNPRDSFEVMKDVGDKALLVGGAVGLAKLGVNLAKSSIKAGGITAETPAILAKDAPKPKSTVPSSIAKPKTVNNSIGTSSVSEVNLHASKASAVNGGAKNRLAHENYLTELRKEMSKPYVEDNMLKGIIDNLYRPGANIGSGSTAAAVRVERLTGHSVSGKMHTGKARQRIKNLERWLIKNPTAKPGDRAAAENVIKDLRDSLK